MTQITVIITTYNRKNLVERAISSVLAQTYTDYNIIVIDDGSKDHTSDLKILSNPKIKYIGQKNKGTSAAKNKGLQHCNTPFIAFLDSDDTWDSNKLQTQIDFMKQNPEFLISYTDEIWIRNNKKVNQSKKHLKIGGDIFNNCISNCFIGISTVMIRKELLKESKLFDETLPVCEDYDLWLRISAKYKIAFIKTKLTTKYALPHKQLSFSNYPMEKYRLIALKKINKEKALSKKQHYNVIKAIEKKSKIMLKGAIRRNNTLQIFQYFFMHIGTKLKIYLFFCKKDLS